MELGPVWLIRSGCWLAGEELIELLINGVNWFVTPVRGGQWAGQLLPAPDRILKIYITYYMT